VDVPTWVAVATAVISDLSPLRCVCFEVVRLQSDNWRAIVCLSTGPCDSDTHTRHNKIVVFLWRPRCETCRGALSIEVICWIFTLPQKSWEISWLLFWCRSIPLLGLVSLLKLMSSLTDAKCPLRKVAVSTPSSELYWHLVCWVAIADATFCQTTSLPFILFRRTGIWVDVLVGRACAMEVSTWVLYAFCPCRRDKHRKHYAVPTPSTGHTAADSKVITVVLWCCFLLSFYIACFYLL